MFSWREKHWWDADVYLNSYHRSRLRVTETWMNWQASWDDELRWGCWGPCLILDLTSYAALNTISSHICLHLWGTSYTPEVSMTLSLGWLIWWSSSQNSENPYTWKITGLLLRILKDTNQQPDEEINKWGTKQRSICPHGVCGPVWWNIEGVWFPNLEALGTFSFGFL